MQLFHYHLVTRKAREVEARYVAKLGFELVARHGRVGDAPVSFEPGVSWEELDARGFRLRLSELERGAVNIVVQPGQWVLPRVDHLGVALDEDEFAETLERAAARGLRVQERSGRRTFVTTGAGYRLELHPPRDWIDELLEQTEELHLAELHLLADDPRRRPGRSPTCSTSTRGGTAWRSARRRSASFRAARPGARSSTPSSSCSRAE